MADEALCHAWESYDTIINLAPIAMYQLNVFATAHLLSRAILFERTARPDPSHL